MCPDISQSEPSSQTWSWSKTFLEASALPCPAWPFCKGQEKAHRWGRGGESPWGGTRTAVQDREAWEASAGPVQYLSDRHRAATEPASVLASASQKRPS